MMSVVYAESKQTSLYAVTTCCACLFAIGSGCCDNAGRDWEVAGSVIDAENGEPLPGANVEVRLVFAIDGPGNRILDDVMTDEGGVFVARSVFTASCAPVAFGFFGSEASNTSGPPRWVDVTVRTEGIETFTEFSIRGAPELVTEFEQIPGVGIRGRIELPEIAADVQP